MTRDARERGGVTSPPPQRVIQPRPIHSSSPNNTDVRYRPPSITNNVCPETFAQIFVTLRSRCSCAYLRTSIFMSCLLDASCCLHQIWCRLDYICVSGTPCTTPVRGGGAHCVPSSLSSVCKQSRVIIPPSPLILMLLRSCLSAPAPHVGLRIHGG